MQEMQKEQKTLALPPAPAIRAALFATKAQAMRGDSSRAVMTYPGSVAQIASGEAA